jgi:hypothetical protein
MNLDTVLFVLIASVPFFIGTIWAVVNAAQKDFGSIGKKAFWVMVASFPFIGFLIYLIIGFRMGKKSAL